LAKISSNTSRMKRHHLALTGSPACIVRRTWTTIIGWRSGACDLA
jgi:hypothetical protein